MTAAANHYLANSLVATALAINDYPTSDGLPMAETDLHRAVMFELMEALKLHFSGQRVYVSGNLLIYYREGDRRRHVAPDVFVVKDAEPRMRPNYLLWQEQLSPNVVIEVTSKSTKREDQTDKFLLYRDELKVKEYFLYDPLGDYLHPPLQGHRLDGEEYIPLMPVNGRLVSEELKLHLEAQPQALRLWDPATQHWIPTLVEENARLRAENERLRGHQ